MHVFYVATLLNGDFDLVKELQKTLWSFRTSRGECGDHHVCVRDKPLHLERLLGICRAPRAGCTKQIPETARLRESGHNSYHFRWHTWAGQLSGEVGIEMIPWNDNASTILIRFRNREQGILQTVPLRKYVLRFFLVPRSLNGGCRARRRFFVFLW